MTDTDSELRPLVQQLIAAADEAIEIQGGVLAELKALLDAAKARDEEALAGLMGRIGETQASLVAAEQRRHGVRSRLAAALGCMPQEVTVERLAPRLATDQAEALRRRRDDLRLVAETVRDQHLKTATFISEFTRVNRALLEGLMPGGQEARTYGTDGKAAWQLAEGLFDARL